MQLDDKSIEQDAQNEINKIKGKYNQEVQKGEGWFKSHLIMLSAFAIILILIIIAFAKL